ncbi:cation:proton antiporter [Kitasatospora sp. NPDC004240]
MSSLDAATATILLALAVIITAGGLLARLAVRFGQPPVIGEIVAGILLGPTLLGLLPGDLTHALFPTSARPMLGVLANIGLVLFMFGVGYELDLKAVLRTRSTALAVAGASILLPLGLGVGLGALLYPWHRDALGGGVSATSFAVFLGVAMSITAFPVLARILTTFRLGSSNLGALVMTSAAVADLVAWSMLALVVTFVSGDSAHHALWTTGGVLLFAVLLATVVRPLLGRLLTTPLMRRSSGTSVMLTLVVLILLASWATTRLGFHPIFGAFAVGVIVPRAELQRVAPEVPLLIEQSSRWLVPVFFITAGLNVDIAGLGGRGVLELAAVALVACLGKFGGATAAARLSGMDLRQASAVGVLMNTRGLTELVVLQVGLSIGVLDTSLNTSMVIMAVLTTAVAPPLFRRIYKGEPGAVPTTESPVESASSKEKVIQTTG